VTKTSSVVLTGSRQKTPPILGVTSSAAGLQCLFPVRDANVIRAPIFELYGSSFLNSPATFNGDVIAPGQGIFYFRHDLVHHSMSAVLRCGLLAPWKIQVACRTSGSFWMGYRPPAARSKCVSCGDLFNPRIM
jgi:hypothetical protein